VATLFTKNLSTLVSDQVAAIQSAASTLINFSTGSVLKAVVQAGSSVALWLQGLILQLLTVTRLATSTGSDVDSFLADFGAFGSRLGAVQATGQLNYFRATPTIAAAVPIGALSASGDGTQTYAVIADPTNAAYSATFNNYPIAIGITSINVTVQAVTGGTGANVSAGGISIMQTGVVGVDGVTNLSAFTNGIAAETDAAVKTRFQNWLTSLFNASESAIIYAVQSVNQNLQVTIIEQPTGSPQVLVTVDDGSGAISGTLVNAASVAVNAIRAAGVSVGVQACTKLTANVSAQITTAAGYVHATVVGQVALAITAYINAVGLGNQVNYMQLAAVAFGVPGVTDVTNVLLNGFVSDLVPTPTQTYKAGTVSVA
jgi:hypothetical protein